MRRRTYLRTVGAAAVAGALAGCAGDGDGDGGNGDDGNGPGENEVIAGPPGENVFEPATITVSTGESVTWRFETAGHNVECKPSESDYASLPDGAEPFASYEGSNRFTFDEEGSTYSYTFEVAGTYDYVCVPHATQGMRGTVVVE